MKATIKVLLITVIGVSIFAFAIKKSEKQSEIDAVKELVTKAYVNGAFNALDPDAMAKGFHEDFSIYSAKGEALGKYRISDWVSGTRKRKAGDYDPNDKKNVMDATFVNVDVTGGAAQVKIELRNQGRLVYTDYLSLLKFEEGGWRIVAKVYHGHKSD